VTAPETSRPPLHVVVTCANRKRRPVPAHLHMRRARQIPLERQFATWVGHLAARSPELTSARDLYAGEHWQVARSLRGIAEAAGYNVTLWVCSAGYGVIPADALLHPYAATLAFGHEDSVADSSDELRRWWHLLSTWQGPVADAPRSLAALAAGSPDATILVAVSAAYLRACANDLVQAAGKLRRSEQLTVISAGSQAAGEVGDLLAPADARLQSALGGSLMSLNARAVAHILQSSGSAPVERPTVAALLHELAATQPQWTKPQRTAATDEDLRALIKSRLADGPISRSVLLREVRSAGRACEQGRFSRLYADVAGAQ
jgi:hypothetical protein